MSKCLRCGAGSEWIQGRVPDEQPDSERVCVPTDPTDKMMDAGRQKVYEYDTRLGDTDGLDSRLLCANEVWSAMIDASREG